MQARGVDRSKQPDAVARAGDAEALRAGCPMAALLETLTRPWTMHILLLLGLNGPMRFGVLRRKVEGISARLLTVRLRTLEAEGFVKRTATGGKVPEVIYAPTQQLADFHEVLALLQRFSAKWRADGAREA